MTTLKCPNCQGEVRRIYDSVGDECLCCEDCGKRWEIEIGIEKKEG